MLSIFPLSKIKILLFFAYINFSSISVGFKSKKYDFNFFNKASNLNHVLPVSNNKS